MIVTSILCAVIYLILLHSRDVRVLSKSSERLIEARTLHIIPASPGTQSKPTHVYAPDVYCSRSRRPPLPIKHVLYT